MSALAGEPTPAAGRDRAGARAADRARGPAGDDDRHDPCPRVAQAGRRQGGRRPHRSFGPRRRALRPPARAGDGRHDRRAACRARRDISSPATTPCRSVPAGRPPDGRARRRRRAPALRDAHRARGRDAVPVSHQRRRLGDDAGRRPPVRPGRRRSAGSRRDPDRGPPRRAEGPRRARSTRAAACARRRSTCSCRRSRGCSCWRRRHWRSAASPRSWCGALDDSGAPVPAGQLTLAASAGLAHPLGGPPGEARFLFEAPVHVGAGAVALTAAAPAPARPRAGAPSWSFRCTPPRPVNCRSRRATGG